MTDFNDIEKLCYQLGQDIGRALPGWVMDGLDTIGLKTQADHFIQAGRDDAMDMPADPVKLTSRSGRLIRSYGAAGGSFSAAGKNEGIQEVKVSGNTVIGSKGSSVPYAAIHEYGGTIEQTVTDKQRAFFWAMAMELNDEKFKAMALSKTLTIKIPARPALEPAINESVGPIKDMIIERIQEMARGLFEA